MLRGDAHLGLPRIIKLNVTRCEIKTLLGRFLQALSKYWRASEITGAEILLRRHPTGSDAQLFQSVSCALRTIFLLPSDRAPSFLPCSPYSSADMMVSLLRRHRVRFRPYYSRFHLFQLDFGMVDGSSLRRTGRPRNPLPVKCDMFES